MRRPLIGVVLSLVVGGAALSAGSDSGWRIVRVDPRFDQLVPRAVVVEVISSEHTWVEGPVWDRSGGVLLFSDIPRNAVFRWSARFGTDVYLHPSGYTGMVPFAGREPGSNGLAFDADGHLILAEHGDRRIARLERDGTKTTLAELYDGKRLNSPNDLVVASDGDIYFTDPPFGLPETFTDPQKELSFSGVYRLAPDGALSLLTRELDAPNGIALSPDAKTLYVSNADKERAVWVAFDLRDGEIVGESRLLFDATAWSAAGTGAPDGIEVDRHGNLFTAGPRGLHVLSATGEHLGSFETDVPVANCAWGEDGSTLFIAASTSIYRVQLRTGRASAR